MLGRRVGQASGPPVIVGEALDLLGERNEAGGGEDARLTHTSAEALAFATAALHELAGAREQ